MLFSNGSTVVARQDKGLEYGCSADAAVKLASAVLASQSRPVVLLHCDAAGICHAPHALARSWYFERGFGDCAVFLHDAGGALVRVTVEKLTPAVPRIALS